MPLSVDKLIDLLNSKGFLINKYFILDGLCFYLEIFSIKTAEVFLLYIPSKYEFEISKKMSSVYKIKYINMESSDNVMDEYANENQEPEDVYGDMNVELSPDKEKIEEHLENNYKHAIDLKDISDEDTNTLKAIYRQTKRLKNCVQNLKYKIGIGYKNYLCGIRRDDTISCFLIKHMERIDKKKLYVIVDLETFYEKEDKLLEDVFVIRETIYNVLKRNQGMHSRVINKMLQNKKDIALIPKQAEQKMFEYDSISKDYEKMLTTMLTSEKKLLNDIKIVDSHDNTGLQSDIERAHTKSRLEKELDNVNSVKGEIMTNILSIREKQENCLLNIDKIMFDNTVMWDAMLNNFAKLKDLC